MADYDALVKQFSQNVQKQRDHLAYTYNKIMKLPEDVSSLDDESLETWESFSSRFARLVDIYTMKYLRVCLLREDPGFNGTFRDMLNTAAKLGFIDDVDFWMEIRALRNITAHEYREEELTAVFKQMKAACPKLLKLKF